MPMLGTLVIATDLPDEECSPREIPLKRRVLVADDNSVNRFVAKSMLDKLQCESTLVADGAAAVEAVAIHHFDVILMDCHMPNVDGWEATRRIRLWEAAQGSKKRVPILALTADARRVDCINAGMDDYLSKPFTLDQLRELIERHVPNGGTRAGA